MRPHLRLLAVAVVALLAACSRGRDDANVKVSFDAPRADSAATQPLAPGDVRVTSTDHAIVLAVIGDSVRFQLADSLRDKVKHEMDTAGADNAIASAVMRSMSGVVASAMGVVVSIPVGDIENVRYEDGAIKFETHGKHSNFSMGGRNDRKDSADHGQFSREDGERFVAAVKARQAALGTSGAKNQ